MSAQGSRTLAALALQIAALALLVLALLGTAWLDSHAKPRLLVLVDRSHSVPRAAADPALAQLRASGRQAGAGEMQVIEFAGRPAPPAATASSAEAALEPAATDLQAALQAALAAHAQAAFEGLVVISDGWDNRGDATSALQAARQAFGPLQWVALGREPLPTRITQVLAPQHARLGQSLALSVHLAGKLDAPLRVKVSARSADGQTRVASAEVQGAPRVALELDTVRAGAMVLDVVLEDPLTGRTLDAQPDAAAIAIQPAATILYAQGTPGAALAHSLQAGAWSVQRVPAAQLDAHAETLDSYQAVVLDDVAVADAGPRFWNALADAVQGRGLGLLVLGGERSFARGGYRGSVLESVLPLSSEPAALDEPVNVVFAVDKSGSMGQGSGGVNRFALAQRAVIETARDLGPRDALGLMVFDVVPRRLVALGPAPQGQRALERDWLASPQGGTQLAPALEAALQELEAAPAGRRLLVLVTDGFVDAVPLLGLQARLERSRIETVALAVGPDADVKALQQFFGAQASLVLRVDEAADLPRVMRAGLDRRRARIEQGHIGVKQVQPLPFGAGRLEAWPAIAAHAVTRAQPQALVPVRSERGEPLIALQTAGRGRVAAVTCGLGPWSPLWLRWHEWPQLAGGLAQWVSATPRGPALGLAVRDLPQHLVVEADMPTATLSTDTSTLSLAVDTPREQGRAVSVERVAPGRWRASLPEAGAGLYTFLISSEQGTQRHLHLRHLRDEDAAFGINPALATWQRQGLIVTLDPSRPAPAPAAQANERSMRPADRWLIGLALSLFLAGVIVDRVRFDTAGIGSKLRKALAPRTP